MRYLLKDGIIVTPTELKNGSVLVKGSKISKVFESEDDLPTVHEEEIIDCKGCYILPGIIDPHVHLRDFQQANKETIYSGTKAAQVNGVTTVIGMPNTVPPLDSINNIKSYIQKIKETAHCNVGLYTRLPKSDVQHYLHELKKIGIFGIKIYPGDASHLLDWELLMRLWDELKEHLNEYLRNTDDFIRKLDVHLDHQYTKSQLGKYAEKWNHVFGEIAKNGLQVLFHADVPLESKIREIRFKTFDGIHKSNLIAHSVNHSKLQELLHIYFIFRMVQLSDVKNTPPITFCHVSSIEAVHLIKRLHSQIPSKKIFIEITPHHTFLHNSIKLPILSHAKVLPPLRTEVDNKEIQDLLIVQKNENVFFGTDHAPHSIEDKSQPFFKTPPGFPSLDVYSHLVLSEFFNRGWDLRKFVYYASYNPACIYQIKKKGLIHSGYDADLLIIRKIDPFTLDREKFHSTSSVCPYPLENTCVKIEHVLLGGKMDENAKKGTFIQRSYKWSHTK